MGIEIRPLRPRVFFEMAIIWGAGRFRSAAAVDFAEQVRSAALVYADEASLASARSAKE
jgi:Trk K+ transport system NAD-binding subunit